jgi:drug/metabolite transporter (DMT)-like permease
MTHTPYEHTPLEPAPTPRSFPMAAVYVAATVLFTVYGQLVIKWQVTNAGDFPVDLGDKLHFLVRLLLKPWVITAFAAAFVAAITWMAALTKLDLSHAYPFQATSFVLVLLLSAALLGESINAPKVAGILLIVAGLVVGSQG